MSEIQKWRAVAEKRGMPYGTYRTKIYNQGMTPEQAAKSEFRSRKKSMLKSPDKDTPLELIPDAPKVERTSSEVEKTIIAMYRAGMMLSPKQTKYLSKNKSFFSKLSQFNEEREKNMNSDRRMEKKEQSRINRKKATHGYYAISEKLRYLIAQEGISLNSFAIKVSVHPTQFSNILRHKMSTGDRARKNICKYFNCKEEELFIFAKKGEQHKIIAKINEEFLKDNK